MKALKCKICRQPATLGGVSPVCSFSCAVELAKRQREKKEAKAKTEARREVKARKEKIKTRADHLKEAQAACNKFIRARDAALACISCGTTTALQWDAGHYKTTASRPGLRFHPYAIHKQCSRCNDHLSGNIHPYRLALIEKVGQEMVDYLDHANPFSGWTIEEIVEIRAHYKGLIKELKNGRS